MPDIQQVLKDLSEASKELKSENMDDKMLGILKCTHICHYLFNDLFNSLHKDFNLSYDILLASMKLIEKEKVEFLLENKISEEMLEEHIRNIHIGIDKVNKYYENRK